MGSSRWLQGALSMGKVRPSGHIECYEGVPPWATWSNEEISADAGLVTLTLNRFEGPCSALSLSSSSKLFACAGGSLLEPIIAVWTIPDFRRVAICRGHTARVTKVAMDPTGDLVASSSEDGTIRVYEARSGECRSVFQHAGPVCGVAWSPDGSRVAGPSGNDIAVWNVEGDSSQKPTLLQGHAGPVHMAVFNPDGRTVFSGSEDHAARVWDYKTGTQLAELKWTPGGIGHVATNSSGSILVSSSGELNRLWDSSGGNWRDPQPYQTVDIPGGTREVRFGCDDQLLAVAISRNLALVSVGTMDPNVPAKPTLLEHDADVMFVRYLPDTTLAATATEAGDLHLWSWESGVRVGSANPLHEGAIVGLEVHDGLILTAGVDGLLKVSFFEPPCFQCKLFWNDLITCGFDLSKDGRLAASGDDGCNVKVWDLSTGSFLDLKGHGNEVYGCGFSPDGKLLASGGAEKLVCVWDLASAGGKLVRKLNMQIDGQLADVSCVAFHPSGKYLAACGPGTCNPLQIWNPITGERLQSLDYLHFPGRDGDLDPAAAVPMRRWSFCDFSPSGAHLAVAANAQGLLVWDTQSWQLQRVLILQPGIELGTVRWSPCGKQIATASNSENAVAGVFGLDSDEPQWVRSDYGAKGGSAHRRYLGWTHQTGSRFVMTTTGGLALISAENGDMLAYTPSMNYKNVQMAPDDKLAVGVYNGRHGKETYKGGVVAWTVFSSAAGTMDWEHYECMMDPIVGADQPLAPVVLDHEGYSLAMRAIINGDAAFLKSLLNTVAPGAHTLRVTSAAHKDAALLAAVRSGDREMLSLLMGAWEQGKLMHTTTDAVALFWPLLTGVRKRYPGLFLRFLEHGPASLGPVQWHQPEQQQTEAMLVAGSSNLSSHSEPGYLWGSGQVVYGKVEGEKQQSVKVAMVAKVLPLAGPLSMTATHSLLHMLTDNSPPLPLDTYNLPAVRALIRLKWEFFARALSLRELCLHLCLVAAFSLFGVLLPEVIQTQPGGGAADMVLNGAWPASLLFLGLAACFTQWEVYQKALQWWRLGTRRMWLGNPFFDFLDVTSFMLLGAIVPLYLVCTTSPERDPVTQEHLVNGLVITASIESVLVWARVLYFMLAYQATGPLVRMIVHIIRDISFFLVLLLCTLLGFGLSFYLLFNFSGSSTSDQEIDAAFSSVPRALLTTFSMMVGNFNQDMFWDARSPVLAVALFVLYIIVMLVVLFNLLIAILSDSFERVKDTEEVEFLKGRAHAILRLEATLSHRYRKLLESSLRRFLHFLTLPPTDPMSTGIAAEAAQNGGQWLGRLRETERRVARLVAASEARVLQRLDKLSARLSAAD